MASKVFSLEGKGLKLDTAADLEAHIAPLRASEDVEEVRINGNTLGVEACKLLGEVLATKKTLKFAQLADIFTGRLLSEIPDALDFLLTSLLNLPNLNTINLNDNAFGINTVKPLLPFLSGHVPLQHLYLNNNGLGPHAGILVADALSELYAKKEAARKDGKTDVPDLETVICGRNRLENGSMTAWAKTYSLHSNIKEIKMVQNGIRQEGISHLISEGLNHCKVLKVLDLQDNTFTITGAKALAKVAPLWTEIKELGVGDSLLGAKGGVKVAAALAKGRNKKLEIIRLQFNEITAPGIKGFAKAAEHLPALKKIEINGNKITEDDESILKLQEILEARKEKFGGDIVDEEEWGLDELDELEDPSDDEEEEDEADSDEEEDVSTESRAEKLVKEAEEAQEEPTVQLKDKEVDALADKLGKTDI